jgi:hypothetical protein
MFNHRRRVDGYRCIYDTQTSKTIELTAPIYVKFSPLLDPIHYLTGRYDTTTNTKLPDIGSKSFISRHEKITGVMNMAYVDALFNYLSGQLVDNQQFIHGVEFYGTYTGIQSKFRYNLAGDYTDVCDHSYFIKGVDCGKFEFENINQHVYSKNSRRYKPMTAGYGDRTSVISTLDEWEPLLTDDGTEAEAEAEEADCCTEHSTYNACNSNSEPNDSPCSSLKSGSNSRTEYSGSECSDEDRCNAGDDDDDNHFDNYDADFDEPDMNILIENFPVQLICMERCTDTLDSILHLLSESEMKSMFMQIVMILTVYQNRFQFTHNDLHTNNIMWVQTDVTNIEYMVKDVRYKVPTFGRIYKIIDFGRSIYTVEGKRFCSDAFAPHGDAYGQYNCTPFFDDSRPSIEPNPSFDLCLLACVIFEVVFKNKRAGPWMYDSSMVDLLSDVQKTVLRWGMDDRGKHIAYQQNGEDRYPGFKLYKMIARTVHNCVPDQEIQNMLFANEFIVDKFTSIEPDPTTRYCYVLS